jgi:hypothetical protein
MSDSRRGFLGIGPGPPSRSCSRSYISRVTIRRGGNLMDEHVEFDKTCTRIYVINDSKLTLGSCASRG